MARCSRLDHVQQCVLLVVFLASPSYSFRSLKQQQLASDVRHTEQVLEAAAAPVPGDARRPLTTNSTCARGEPYIDCYADPCAYFPCPVGYLGEPSGCGGTCRCSCRTDKNATSITNATTGVTDPVNAANTAGNTAAADAAQQELFPQQQQQQQHDRCFAAYEYCTCSAQCCHGLICSYPLRSQQESGLYAANSSIVGSISSSRGSTPLINSTTAAGVSSNGSISNGLGTVNSSARAAASVATTLGVANSSINSSLQEAAVNVGGPSCRTLEETDGISGVINYGC